MFKVIKTMAKLLALCLIIPSTIWAFEANQKENPKIKVLSKNLALDSIDSEKLAKINLLMDVLEVDKLPDFVRAVSRMHIYAFVPPLLSDSLSEAKALSEQKKRELVPYVQNHILPNVLSQAVAVFETASFNADVLDELKLCYAKDYSSKEIKELINFYRSPIGKKVMHSYEKIYLTILDKMLEKYMPMSILEAKKETIRAMMELQKMQLKSIAPRTSSVKLKR